MNRWLFIVAAALLAMVPNAAPLAGAPPTPPADPARNDGYPIVVVLDTSDSMSATGNGGLSRIDAARAAVLQLVALSTADTQFGLVAYPGINSASSGGCDIGREEVPLGGLNQIETSAAVRRLTPSGNTPTGPALRHGADVIKAQNYERGTIILLSDGESNCGGDPCDVAKQLESEGLEVTVNTVSLQISTRGASELQCIADATRGRYASAEDPAGLQSAFQDMVGAKMSFDITVPAQLPAVSGTGSSGTVIPATVTNTGHAVLEDVRVSLDFRDSAGTPGAILVPRPIRFLGNLAPGEVRRIEIVVRPDAARLGKFIGHAAAYARNAQPQNRNPLPTEVVEPFKGLSGLLGNVDRAVILGDSYSSGEGTKKYDPVTNTAQFGNVCHRSPDAYGPRLFPGKAMIIACSGALTSHFFAQQPSGSQDMPAQLEVLRNLAVDKKTSPDAVLLSIGGNDIDFAKIVATCVLRDCAANDFEANAVDRVNRLPNDLNRVYTQVDRAVNDSKARGVRGGALTPIVVVPYPRITPIDESTASEGCFAGITATEVGFLNRLVGLLNQQIRQVVTLLGNNGVPVFYARDVEAAFQPNHTVCDGAQSYAVSANPAEIAAAVPGWVNKAEFAHPTSDGHAAMARAIAAATSTLSLGNSTPAPDWHNETLEPHNPVMQWLARQQAPFVDMYEAGGLLVDAVAGFAESSQVIYRVESTPRVLGNAIADANGTASASLWLPSDLPPGRHTVYASGFDAAGNVHEVALPIRVVAPHSKIALVLVVIGALMIGVAVIGFRSGRGRRASVAAGPGPGPGPSEPQPAAVSQGMPVVPPATSQSSSAPSAAGPPGQVAPSPSLSKRPVPPETPERPMPPATPIPAPPPAAPTATPAKPSSATSPRATPPPVAAGSMPGPSEPQPAAGSQGAPVVPPATSQSSSAPTTAGPPAQDSPSPSLSKNPVPPVAPTPAAPPAVPPSAPSATPAKPSSATPPPPPATPPSLAAPPPTAAPPSSATPPLLDVTPSSATPAPPATPPSSTTPPAPATPPPLTAPPAAAAQASRKAPPPTSQFGPPIPPPPPPTAPPSWLPPPPPPPPAPPPPADPPNDQAAQ